MKRIVTIIALLVLASSYIMAQNDDDAESGLKNEGIQVGALLGLRAGINTSDLVTGLKNRPVVSSSPDVSVMGTYIIDRKNNTKLSLEFGRQSFVFGYLNSPDNGTKYYFSSACWIIEPQVDFSVLNLGLLFGFPSSYEEEITAAAYGQTNDLGTDQMDTFIEGRIGFDLKVLSSTTGDMMFYGRVGYLFNSPFSTKIVKSSDDHIVSLTFGLGYMFNIPQ